MRVVFYIMQQEKEIWRDVKGYEGFYEVSNLGRVKSLSRIVLRGNKYPFISKTRILSSTINKNGYNRVILSVKSFQKTKLVHILMAETFLNHNPYNNLNIVVDHKNNIRSDNKLSNLQLVTQRFNTSKDKTNKSSKYTGVCFKKSKNTWQAAIMINGKIKHLGYSKNEEQASLLYQSALNELTKIQVNNQFKIEI